jgi:hypothetical protein
MRGYGNPVMKADFIRHACNTFERSTYDPMLAKLVTTLCSRSTSDQLSRLVPFLLPG